MLKRIPLLIAVLLLIPGSAPAQFDPFKAVKDQIEKARRAQAKQLAQEEQEQEQEQEEQREDELERTQTASEGSEPATPPVSMVGARMITYAGYTKEFLPLKRKLLSGDLEGVASYYEEKEAKVREKAKGDDLKFYQKMGFLDFVERGTLDLSRGEFASSIDAYYGAEQVLNIRNNESKAKEKGKAFFGKLAGMVLGKDEFVPYYGVAFERILMLNGKAIAYLLSGDRLAYNVTRRSIDWQNTEKAEFDAEQRKIQEDLAEKKGNDKNSFFDLVEKMVWASYEDLETKAQEIPSAFVNPFGYYMAGMIQEFESVQDPSLIDNARISYKKALELNPGSSVIARAYEAMKNGEEAGNRRLVHIVAFDGFTPEKKVLSFNMPVSPEMIIPVKLPIYQPVDSLVTKLTVTAGEEALSELDQVASVETISLRYQSDRRSKQTLDVLIAVASSVGKRIAAGDNATAQAAVQMHDMMSSPDMRSWMSLPSTISAARFYAPEGVETIEVHSYDDSGRELATSSVPIAQSGPTFVFIRSMDSQLLAYASRSLWFN